MDYRRLQPPFPGYLYCPVSPRPHPGVLLLHGSNGGAGNFWSFPDQPPFSTGELTATAVRAKRLASMGYVAFAFSYFFAEKDGGSYDFWPPEELVRIDIQTVLKALVWLKDCEWVQGLPIGLYGGSRGAELALLLASKVQKGDHRAYPDAVIASAPPDKVVAGFPKTLADHFTNDWPVTDQMIENLPSAWTYGETPINTGADIAVENIASPLLTLYGAKDELWGPPINPVNLYRRFNRLRAGGLHISLPATFEQSEMMNSLQTYWETADERISTHVCFENEGHSIDPHSSAGQFANEATRAFFEKYLSRG